MEILMAVKKGDDGYLHNDMGEVWGYCRVSTTQQKQIDKK